MRCSASRGAASRPEAARLRRRPPPPMLPGRTNRPRISPKLRTRLRRPRCSCHDLRGGTRPLLKRRRRVAVFRGAQWASLHPVYVRWIASRNSPDSEAPPRSVVRRLRLELAARPEARVLVRGELASALRATLCHGTGSPSENRAKPPAMCGVRREGGCTGSSRSRTAPAVGPLHRGDGPRRGGGNPAHPRRCWKAVRTRASAASAR